MARGSASNLNIFRFVSTEAKRKSRNHPECTKVSSVCHRARFCNTDDQLHYGIMVTSKEQNTEIEPVL
ncbi:hypothetical protein MAM1_0021d01832 [Mucor ambiguus]|uniref:Uncharacterized protein n=1 Tax=Mucor ambiguus TaxID=91626 RepID=A0A0C9M6J1_9FUNG|nr:hypothetical protein MAM1_0021d01832 [Mucor ambiguus]